MLKTPFFLILLALFVLPTLVMAQVAGQVVGVRAPAEAITASGSVALQEGSTVSSGDTVKTGAAGQVQLLFADETKIVVGPNSSLRIDATLFKQNGTARKFATSALGGSFRFISGKSPKKVYKITTPVATMGIRGTAFDFTVASRTGTDLLVFEGLVRFCADGKRCAVVPGGCQAVSIGRDREFSQPGSAAEKQALLERFPLLAAQDVLKPPFRADATGCNAFAAIALPSRFEKGDSVRDRENGNPADGPGGNTGGGGNPAE